MAIDQSEKRRALARQLTQNAVILMDTLYTLDALRRKRDNGAAGGTPLAFTDADFTAQTGLAHVDAAAINACFAAIPTIVNAFSVQNFDDIFEMVRP